MNNINQIEQRLGKRGLPEEVVKSILEMLPHFLEAMENQNASEVISEARKYRKNVTDLLRRVREAAGKESYGKRRATLYAIDLHSPPQKTINVPAKFLDKIYSQLDCEELLCVQLKHTAQQLLNINKSLLSKINTDVRQKPKGVLRVFCRQLGIIFYSHPLLKKNREPNSLFLGILEDIWGKNFKGLKNNAKEGLAEAKELLISLGRLPKSRK